MAMNHEDLIRTILTGEYIYLAHSAGTNMPYISCDEETFDDQVWLFAHDTDLKIYYEELKKKKIQLIGKRCDRKSYGNLFAQLRVIGVNQIVWVDGDEKTFMDLDEISPEPVLSEEMQKKKPPMNPALQLSAIYFMQEMRRPVSMEEHLANNARALEEEMLVNVCKSNYYMLLRPDVSDPKKMGPILIQSKEDGALLLPIFSDVMELAKMQQENQGLQVIRVPFVKLKELVPDQVAGVAINPRGFNLVLKREQLLKLIG